jgi:hypothetical protein
MKSKTVRTIIVVVGILLIIFVVWAIPHFFPPYKEGVNENLQNNFLTLEGKSEE